MSHQRQFLSDLVIHTHRFAAMLPLDIISLLEAFSCLIKSHEAYLSLSILAHEVNCRVGL